MKSGVELAHALAKKAEDDLLVAEGILAHALPVHAACFHLQQAAEKLLKAAISSQNRDFPFTHDLRHLLDLAKALFPQLEEFREPLLRFASYAIEVRYEDAAEVFEADAREDMKAVRRLRSVVHQLLPPEALP